jgi:chromosome segregation ATPase
MASENGHRAAIADLPQARQEIAEFTMNQYVTEYHRVSAQRDELKEEQSHLKAKIAGLEVVAAAQQAQIANVNDTAQSQLAAMESRLQSMQLERDQAISDRAVYEALFISLQAQMRAFQVPSAPLVRDKTEEPHESDQHWGGVGDFARDVVNVGRRNVPRARRGEETISQPASVLERPER